MRFRLTRPSDLHECTKLLHPGFSCSPRVRAALPRIWEEHLRARSMCSGLIEDPLLPESERLLFLGVTVFVRDAFLADFLARPEPHLAARIYELILAGRSPLLTRDEIARANATTGVVLVALHCLMRDYDLSKPAVQQVFASSRDCALLVYGGYRLKAYIAELNGPLYRAFTDRAGFHLMADYSDYYARHGLAPQADQAPFLIGATKDSVATGSAVSHFFLFHEPRFNFTPLEQELLLRAIFNESDEEIAAALDIAADTVHKHWRTIYQRVADREPNLLPGDGLTHANGRGPEKRRHLLGHLRLHLEELRPYFHERSHHHPRGFSTVERRLGP